MLKDDESATQVSKEQGRLEIYKNTGSSQLKDIFDWPYLEQFFMLEREVKQLKSGTFRKQVIYGFTSLSIDQISPKELLHLVRYYWGIENGPHYRRDVTFNEDHTRMTNKNLARAMASLNKSCAGYLVLDM